MTLVSKTWQLEQKSDNALFKNKETIKMQLSVLIFRSSQRHDFFSKVGKFWGLYKWNDLMILKINLFRVEQ